MCYVEDSHKNNQGGVRGALGGEPSQPPPGGKGGGKGGRAVIKRRMSIGDIQVRGLQQGQGVQPDPGFDERLESMGSLQEHYEGQTVIGADRNRHHGQALPQSDLANHASKNTTVGGTAVPIREPPPPTAVVSHARRKSEMVYW